MVFHLDGVPFHPYYTLYHDLSGVVLFLFVFCAIVFFAPEMGGYFLEIPNFQEANSLKTPEHVPPVWYFTPFYSMLRAVTYPLFGDRCEILGHVSHVWRNCHSLRTCLGWIRVQLGLCVIRAPIAV